MGRATACHADGASPSTETSASVEVSRSRAGDIGGACAARIPTQLPSSETVTPMMARWALPVDFIGTSLFEHRSSASCRSITFAAVDNRHSPTVVLLLFSRPTSPHHPRRFRIHRAPSGACGVRPRVDFIATIVIANETRVAARAPPAPRCPHRQPGSTRHMEIGIVPPAECPCALADRRADSRQCGRGSRRRPERIPSRGPNA